MLNYQEINDFIIDNLKNLSKDKTLFGRLKYDNDFNDISFCIFQTNKHNLEINNKENICFFDEYINKRFFNDEINLLDSLIDINENTNEKNIYNILKKYIQNEINFFNHNNIKQNKDNYKYFKDIPKKTVMLSIINKLTIEILKEIDEINIIYDEVKKIKNINVKNICEKKIFYIDYDDYEKEELNSNKILNNLINKNKKIDEYLILRNYIKIKIAEFNFLIYYFKTLY